MMQKKQLKCNAQGEKAWKIGHIQENAESVEGADEKIRVIFE